MDGGAQKLLPHRFSVYVCSVEMKAARMHDLALCAHEVLDKEDVVRLDVDDAARSGSDKNQLLPATGSAAHNYKILCRKLNKMFVSTLATWQQSEVIMSPATSL